MEVFIGFEQNEIVTNLFVNFVFFCCVFFNATREANDVSHLHRRSDLS